MILVDPAIGSKELVDPLRALGLEIQPSPIDADIAFEGRGIGGKSVTIGVEYKKLGELVGSIRTERFQGHQVPKMRAFDFRWLVVEGEILVDTKGYLARRSGKRTLKPLEGRMTLNELYRRLVVLQINQGLQWVMVESRDFTLRFLQTLYRTWTDVDQNEHRSHIGIYEPPALVPLSQFRRTVCTLPGIGHDLAGKAERHFGSLREAFQAEEAAWCGIDGIGSKTARKIVNAVTRR
jgi:ERCC4-type nuclease